MTAQFTTEAAIRRRAVEGSAPLGWADKQVQLAREAGLLLTEQQIADLQEKRMFRIGDRARYVGPDRSEPLNEGSGTTFRPYGQEGYISEVNGDVITFQPTDGTRGLQVRYGTRCGFSVERIP